MSQGPLDELLSWGMFGNMVAEIFGIVVTVVIVERYLSWWENRKKRAARELVVSSLGRRLDQLALDWRWVLSFLTLIGGRTAGDRFGELVESLPKHIESTLPESVRAHRPTAPEPSTKPPEPPSRSAEPIDRMLALKLEHISSRLEDVLDAVDGAAVVMSPSMLDLLVGLREELLSNLRSIVDLRDLLANPTAELASNVFPSAMTASLSGGTYAKLLERIWDSIPARSKASKLPKSDYLPSLLSSNEQMQRVRDFLYLHFPDYDPREVIRRADSKT